MKDVETETDFLEAQLDYTCTKV